jgi:hypothetical protein
MTNDRFRDEIWIDFGDFDIETETELAILMKRPKSSFRATVEYTEDIDYARDLKNKGFHVERVQRGDHAGDYKYFQPRSVTQKQLDGAWAYLKGKEVTKRDDYRTPSRNVHYYHKQVVFRDKRTGRFVREYDD